jgi:hypothetical protein
MTGPDMVSPDTAGPDRADPDAAGAVVRAGLVARARMPVAAALLAAVTIAWAAFPVGGGKPGTRAALVVAIICGLASVAHLVVGDSQIGGDAFDSLLVRFAAQLAYIISTLPWSEVMIIAILVLEALHHSRPWHTGLLGAALLAYLFATHLAETATRPGALRPQLPVIAAGLGLLVLAVGAAALPRLHAGPAPELLRVLAVIAAILAGGLALPTARRRGSD